MGGFVLSFELYPDGCGVNPSYGFDFGPFRCATLAAQERAYIASDSVELDVSWRNFSLGAEVGTTTTGVSGHLGLGPISLYGKLRVLPSWLPKGLRGKSFARVNYVEGVLMADVANDRDRLPRLMFNWRDSILGLERVNGRELLSKFRLPVKSRHAEDFQLDVEVHKVWVKRDRVPGDGQAIYRVDVSGGGFDSSYGFGGTLPSKASISLKFGETFMRDTGELPDLVWEQARSS